MKAYYRELDCFAWILPIKRFAANVAEVISWTLPATVEEGPPGRDEEHKMLYSRWSYQIKSITLVLF